MDYFALLASFGGGAFGAAIGGLYAFVMTGFLAIAGSVAAIADVTDLAVGNIAFGSCFGPHIAFAGAVAATAYAANRTHSIDQGTDLTIPLHGTGDPSVLLVGGIFGVFGFLLNYLFSGVFSLPTDTVAMTVAVSGILVRFIFGRSGILGKYDGEGSRVWFSKGRGLLYNLLLGAGIGLMVSGVGISLLSKLPEGVDPSLITANFPVLCFGMAAVTLILPEFGRRGPVTHHIALPAANAAVLCAVRTGNLWIGLFAGVFFGIFTSFLGDFMEHTFNSYCDSHIDPPALTIFTTTFLILLLFG